MSSRFSAGLLSATAFFVTTIPAFAIEPEEAADALVAALVGGSSTEGDYDEAVLDGSDVVISGLTLTRGSAPAGPESADDADAAGAEPDAEAEPDAAEEETASDEGTVTFEETRIVSPTDSDTGVFDSPSITFTGGTIESESSGSIASANLAEVTVLDPEEAEGGEPGQAILFRTAEATDIRIMPENNTGEITIGRMFMETGDVVDNVAQSNKGSVENITIPPEAFADAQVGPQTIGYDNIVLGVTWDGTRDLAANTMTVRDFTVSIQDGGSLSIAGTMGKLPAPSAMNDADATAKAVEAEVHTITIRYDDASLAGRIMDYLAQQQGVSREDYANQIAAALPFLLAAMNNPEFQNEVAGAVGAFLKDPQSLTIKIEPDAPVSGAEIMTIVGSAPQTLPDRLNASVSANTAN